MTSVESMEISTVNTASGSYEIAGRSNRPDAFLIGDTVETSRFPTNTLDAGVTLTVTTPS